MRISRPQMFMQIAQVVARRSTCMRLNVGCVLVVDNRIVSIGYNGPPAGAPHCSGNDCPGRTGCTLSKHAEVNAIEHCPVGNWVQDVDLYVTASPCRDCWERILHWGRVARVFFENPYRNTEHLDSPNLLAIGVYRVQPAGYIFDWHTKELVDVEG